MCRVELVRWPWDTEVQYSFGQEIGGGEGLRGEGDA